MSVRRLEQGREVPPINSDFRRATPVDNFIFTALDVMASGIAHEIRNPLAVCSSAVQFLRDEDLEPELRRDCVEKAIAGIHKATETIENMLRFARLSVTENMTRTDPVALLNQALSVVSHQEHLNTLEVVTSYCPQPLAVLGVPSLLEQAFICILLKSIAAMPEGGVLKLSVTAQDRDVLVRISDSGIGIPADGIGKVFDPSYVYSAAGKDMGLGLSICYSIIQQHHGHIQVESEVGIGTCFSVHLPLA
jgi:signal transduction histidine kinase